MVCVRCAGDGAGVTYIMLCVCCAGDGAGVGKGRTIAGIIYENYLLGRKRSLWYVNVQSCILRTRMK